MKDKIINFLLIFLLVFLTMNLFFGPEDQKKEQTGIKISHENSYSIPANVSLNVENYSSSEIIFDTCRDLKIKKDDKEIFPPNCGEVSLKTGEIQKVDYALEHAQFEDTGKYLVFLSGTGVTTEVISQFEIEHKGFFSKVFTFFFYAPVYNLMAGLLEITAYSLGWAIICITIIIRILLLYPQHKMMVSQRKLQLIQPKIKEIQEKHKGNPQVLWVELMNLYKQEKVNPLGSCGMLLIQMPILIVIYQVIISIQDHANMYYLYDFVGKYDVALINNSFYGVDLLGIWGVSWLVLALIVGILQFIQVKLSLSYTAKDQKKAGIVLEKKKDAKDYQNFMPDPDMLNKFMLYGLPIMIAIFTYTFFAWVGLYWWIGTLFMIVQQYIVNKIIKK